jgi:hypothetical protein
MGLSINLRGDLAKLSDAELASRLQQLWTACDEERDNPKYGAFWYSHRGPIRHPWAYRFFSFTMVPAFLFFFGNFVLWDVTLQMHLKLCEIRDLTDEVQRRTGRARGTG